MRLNSQARNALAVVCVVALSSFAPSVSADPLAILPIMPSGQSRPTAAQRVQLADAVAVTLRRDLPDVLAGGETRTRLEVLDPAQLACEIPACARDVAVLLRARAVVLVRPVLDGARLRLDLIAVSNTGELLVTQHEETTMADWEDAVALGRLAAARLSPALRAHVASTSPASSAPPAQRASVAPASSAPASVSSGGPRLVEAIPGIALVLGGIAAIVIPAVTLGAPGGCASDCNPPPGQSSFPAARYDSPSAQNFAWIVGGGIALVAGVALIVDGLRSHGSGATSARRGAHSAQWGFAVAPDLGMGAISVSGVF